MNGVTISTDHRYATFTVKEGYLSLPIPLYEYRNFLGLPIPRKIILSKLAGSCNWLFFEEYFRIAAARAAYEGFNTCFVMNGNTKEPMWLMSSYVFQHPDGRAIAVEHWKSYLLPQSYKYWTISFYSRAEFLKLLEMHRITIDSENETPIAEFVDKYAKR